MSIHRGQPERFTKKANVHARAAIMPKSRISVGGVHLRFVMVWFAFGLVLLASGISNPEMVGTGALADLLFFGSILALISLGQHIVIAGGGIDLSVSAQLTLGALVFAYVANESPSAGMQILAALCAIGVCLVSGIANGVAVTYLRISPLIATLGISSILAGASFTVPGAIGALQTPSGINELAIGKPIFGFVSRGTIAVALLAATMAAAYRWYVGARELTLFGDNPAGAWIRGLPVKRFRIHIYVLASAIWGLASLWLAGLANTPGITLGQPYLLPSIAAVVIGGTALGGGRGSVSATIGGAFFMTQLSSFALSLYAPIGTQLVVEGGIIALGMALYSVDFATLFVRTKSRRWSRAHEDRTAASEG